MLEDLKLFMLIYIPTLLVVSLWLKALEYKIEKRVVAKVRAKRKRSR